MAYAVVSVIGHDRPGFVRELAALALRCELNIEDTRATGLGSEFAVLMGVTGAATGIDALERALGEDSGLAFVLQRSEPGAAGRGVERVSVTVLAMDHPGIVHSVTGFFAERNLNIEELITETRPAPHTGSPLFDLRMQVSVASDQNVNELGAAFGSFCQDEDLDGSLNAAG